MSVINVESMPNIDPLESQSQIVAADDDTVLIRMAQDDMAAFSALYERYVNRVYRFLLARVGNVHDAEDLTSQTFIAAMKGLKSYQGQSSFFGLVTGYCP